MTERNFIRLSRSTLSFYVIDKGHRNQEDQEELSHSDEKLIKKVCKDNYQPGSHDDRVCKENLRNLEIVSREAEEACQEHSFDHEKDRKKCEKTAEICEKALNLCQKKHKLQSELCQEKRQECRSQIKHNHSLRKILQKMGRNSHVERLNLKASIKGRHSKQSVLTGLMFGSSSEDHGHVVKYFAGAEVELHEKSAQYEVSVQGKIVKPRINNRWNTKLLLQEDLKMELDGQIKYGRKEHTKEISFKTVLEKSEEQRESVRKSPEYLRCEAHEQQSMVLSPTCMKVRHQASSFDRIKLKIELPHELKHQPSLVRVEEVVKSYFISQLKIHQHSPIRSDKEVEIVMDFSRAGDEAQLKVEHSGSKWTVKNIRLPVQCTKGLLPISVRNHVAYSLVQKLSHNKIPASCRVESDYIGTFDNTTYSYEMNNCKHLLFKDRSGKVPVAVLAKSEAGPKSSKVVEILSGVSKVELKPKSQHEAKGMVVEVEIEGGEKKTFDLAHGQVRVEKNPRSGEDEVEIKRSSDNVYNVLFKKQQLQVREKYAQISINSIPVSFHKKIHKKYSFVFYKAIKKRILPVFLLMTVQSLKHFLYACDESSLISTKFSQGFVFWSKNHNNCKICRKLVLSKR